MKCQYLFLVFCTLMTCEAQRSNNDIIWYPVEDEDGVFISIYGEKRRDSPATKWRSHRRARYSGSDQNPVQALPLSYDPTDDQDISFFQNINERRVPGLIEIEENRKKKPHKKLLGQENNLQGIFNEVFDYNKYPSTKPGSSNQYPGTNQWSQRPTINNQWGGRPQQFGTGIQWSSPTTGFPGQRPITSQNNQWGGSRPVQRPNEWSTTGNTNKPSRPVGPDIVFPDETTRNIVETSRLTTTTPSNLIPMDPPTMSPCERLCPVTPEFNPVCGSDAMTYTNAGRLKCAQMCGKDVNLSHYGNCGRTALVTPLVSNNQRKKIKGFWFLSN